MIHLQIAEAGKRRMLRRDYQGALERFRAALHMAVSQQAPPVFVHHYTDCILDCLEESGDHGQALELVERALDDHDPERSPLGPAIRADLLQRRIMLLFAVGRVDDGDRALAATEAPRTEVVEKIRAARRRRLAIDARWVIDTKRRHSISSVSSGHLRTSDADSGETYFQKELTHGRS